MTCLSICGTLFHSRRDQEQTYRFNPSPTFPAHTTAKPYRDPDRRYVHLLDGGLSDNLGLRGPFQAVTSIDNPWSILTSANMGRLDPSWKPREVIIDGKLMDTVCGPAP
jgi:hypothetical protein